MQNLKIVKNMYTVLTVCLIAVGAVLLIWPQMGLDVLCIVYGIFLIVYGAAKLSSYFAKDIFQLAFQFDLALGIVSIIMGIIMIFRARYMIEIMSTCIGIFMLFDAALKIQTALEAKKFGITKWWLILAVSVVVTVIGILLLIKPFQTVSVITRLIGLNLCLDGVLNLCVVQSTVKTVRRKKEWEA